MNRATLLCLLSLISFATAVNLAQNAVPGAAERYEFRLPQRTAYRVTLPESAVSATALGLDSLSNRSGIPLRSAETQVWLRACQESGTGGEVQLGRHVVLQLDVGRRLAELIAGRPLKVHQVWAANLFMLEAPDAWTAASEAQRLSGAPGVFASYPVMRHKLSLLAYARRPNDPYFPQQWHLENRDDTGASLGADLNTRAAWPVSQGEGVIIGIADNGVELAHPELAPRAASALHFSFVSGQTNGGPSSYDASLAGHGTAVAGLAVAEGNNQRGIIGVAPKAQFASWVVFDETESMVTETNLADMFQYRSNIVWVQNHSWGNGGTTILAPTLVEKVGVSNAVLYGRGGLGVVMVRGGGNGRGADVNANDDGFLADPQIIAVGAVRSDGRVASYSDPGACLLCAAPSDDSEQGFPTLFTTDLLGDKGFNSLTYSNDLADYAFGQTGFVGTSGSTPLISGLAALVLSANPALSYRDVQQILIFASRQLDPGDPDLTTNGAGFRVSHNTGFGVPDAGVAVDLARRWHSRPALMNLTFSSTNVQPIPDAGLRVLVSGDGVPANLTSIVALAGDGPHPDVETPSLPLVDVGLATNAITQDLSGKAALIQRGGAPFAAKINRAASAGAAFAVVYDNADHTLVEHMAGTDFTTIPAVLIAQDDGDRLHIVLQNQTNVLAQLKLTGTSYAFPVTNTLLLEHVAVRLALNHPSRGDLRVTLLSPQGTRSVLQHYSSDISPAPTEWTYVSTHHFYESSAGTWTVAVADEYAGSTGAVQAVDLVLSGTPIMDSDRDGLDDGWEIAHFGGLTHGPKDDVDLDGYNNAQEQILGTNPMLNETPLQVELSIWNDRLTRINWPGQFGKSYEVWRTDALNASLSHLTNVAGVFPETVTFMPYTNAVSQFYQIRTTSP